MIVETRSAPPFFKNGFVLGCEDTLEAVIIDPGDEVQELVAVVRRHRLQPRHILLTHAHLDHITGVAAARRTFDVPVWLHRDDNFLYEGVVQQGMMFGIRVEPQPKIDHFYEPGQTIEFGNYRIQAHHTPGHCPGGVCLEVNGVAGTRGPSEERSLFVGDTLFAGSIGRTDLPGGDLPTLEQSIRGVLYAFPDTTPVYSGHGEVTTIGRERSSNPFVRG